MLEVKIRVCALCGTTFQVKPLGQHARFCSAKCRSRDGHLRRDPNRPKRMIPCPQCGKQIERAGRAPLGEQWCRDCRSAQRRADNPRVGRRTPCLDCGAASRGQRCKPCASLAQRVRPYDDGRVRRADREKAVAGLPRKQREALLVLWVSQKRACAYCADRATTMDHVIPLVRGGTNFEGNLVPCCRPCNGSKAGHLLSDWLYLRGARVSPRRLVRAA